MNIRREDGIAMIVAIMALLLMSALGAALVLTTASETIIAANFRNGSEALYGAEAALERSLGDLLAVQDWNSLLSGAVRSAFIDGAPSGIRTRPDGSTIDLGRIVSLANCEKVAACTSGEMNLVTSERPWGANNPRWQLYAYGPLSGLTSNDIANALFYVVVMVADDPSENDDDPTRDGASDANPGMGVLSVRAEAFGPRGAHKAIEATVARTGSTALERGYMGQPGQDEQSRRAGKAAVQTPGKTLSMTMLDINPGGRP
jgi:hypothetical protein